MQKLATFNNKNLEFGTIKAGGLPSKEPSINTLNNFLNKKVNLFIERYPNDWHNIY